MTIFATFGMQTRRQPVAQPPRGKGNVYRRLLAAAVERNAGYLRAYRECYPLSWDVSLTASIPSYDKLFADRHQIVADCLGPLPDLDKFLPAKALTVLKDKWSNGAWRLGLWNRVTDDMRESLTGGDTYRTMAPEVATRYGLPVQRFPRKYRRLTMDDVCYHPASKQGWVLEDPWVLPFYRVKWAFAGRNGKHLVLSEFEGRRLDRCSSEELAEAIRSGAEGTYSNKWCQALLAMIHEWDTCFTRKAVEDEFVYQCKWQFAQKLEIIHDAAAEAGKEAAERDYWAERDIVTV